MRFRTLLVYSSAACALAACATVGATVGQILPDQSTLSGKKAAVLTTAGATDYSASSSAGKGLATAENRGAIDEFTVSMPAVEADLNALLQTVASQWPHPVPNPPRVKVALGTQYQAVTFPDGVIVVKLGALDSVSGEATTDMAVSAGYAQSDQELQYMLAHEFAHYALGHHNKTDSMSRFRDMASTVAAVHNAGATLSRMRYTQNASGGQLGVSDQRGLQSDIGKAIGLYERVDVLTKSGVSPAWNRAQEDDADALALDLMKAAGVNGTFYQDVFGKLKQQEKLSDQLTRTLQTSVMETQKTLLSPQSVNAMVQGQGQQVLQTSTNQLVSNFLDQATSTLVSYLGATHRSPEVRLKGIMAYEAIAYPDADPFDVDDPSMTVIAKVRANAQFKEAKIATIAYYDAIARHAQGDVPGAEAAIDRALATSFKTQAAILYRAGKIAEGAGKRDKAIGYYTQAIADPAGNPEAYRSLAALQIDKNDIKAALATIARGETQLGDPDYFLPTRILMATRQNLADVVVALTVQCRATKREDLVVACEAHRAGLDPEKLTPEQRQALERQQVREGGGLLQGIIGAMPGAKTQ